MSISLIVNSFPNTKLLHPIVEGIESQTDSDFELEQVYSAKSLASHIESAQHEYLVFLGANCIPNIDFIKAHRRAAKRGIVSVSSRIFLDQTISQHVLDNQISPCCWSTIDLLALRISGHVNKLFPCSVHSIEGEFATFGAYKSILNARLNFQTISKQGTVLQLARLITK